MINNRGQRVRQIFVKRPWVFHIGALLFYVFATTLMLFPLSVQVSDHVRDWGDPLEFAWVMAWDSRQLAINPLELYNANIYYPYPNSLAFAESQVASGVMAQPIYLATANPILAHNFVFLLTFALGGFTFYLLAYDLTGSRGGALLAGFAFAFWSYKFNHLSHLNLVALQWLPLIFFSLRRALGRPSFTYALLFGISFAGQTLSSWYYAIMTGLALLLYFACWLVSHRRLPLRASLIRIAAVMLPILVLVSVLAIPYFQLNRTLNLTRTLEDAARLSANPASFITVAPSNQFYRELLPNNGAPEALFPGLALVALALLGLIWGKGLPDRLFWIVLGISFFLICFGPIVHVSASSQFASPLYRLLYDWVPGFQGTRAPARFFVVTMFALCVFAAWGFAKLSHRIKAHGGTLLGILLLAVMIGEYNSAPFEIVPIETGAQIAPSYRWLAQQPEGNVLELPTNVGDVTQLSRAMYFSIFHRHTLPVGYGSFIPPTQDDFLTALQAGLETPSPRLPNVLREFDVRYVVVRENADAAAVQQIESAFAQFAQFAQVYSDDTHRIYRVAGDAPPHPLTFHCLLPLSAAPNGRYTPYLVVQQPRHYPIVNDDLQAHRFTLEWMQAGSVRAMQTQSVTLPRVLRDRPEGVSVQVQAPSATGDYTLRCTLDKQILQPLGSDAHVQVQPSKIPELAIPPLQLVAVTRTPNVVHAGSELIATFFWRRIGVTNSDVWMHSQLVDANHHVWSEITRQPVKYRYPVRLWGQDELVADEYALPVPPDAPSGDYQVVVSLLENANDSAGFLFVSPNGDTTHAFASDEFKIIQP